MLELKALFGVAAIAASLVVTADLAAQDPDSVVPIPGPAGFVGIGSFAEEWLRTQQVVGVHASAGFTIRSAASLSPELPGEQTARWRLIAPEMHAVWNSAIPLSRNDGAMWAGRGSTVGVAAGVQARYGPIAVMLRPELIHAANRRFDLLPSRLQQRRPGRSVFAFPFQADTNSSKYRAERPIPFSFPIQADSGFIDLPIRFGDEPYTLLDAGQSSVSVDIGQAIFGLATENQWWGPGLWNGVVLTNNAGGFPHAFLRSAAPLRTRAGTVHAKWIVGGLTESLFFDDTPSNDLRSIAGIAAEFQPAFEPDLSLGLVRMVYAPVDGRGEIVAHALDPVLKWDRRRAPGDTNWNPATEQILAFFGRWVFPQSGVEAYGEWARLELPVSVRELLSDPGHSQAYVIGAQWAKPAGSGLLRLQSEAAYLEKSSSFKHRPVGSYYTSRTIPQGYTHRGQVVGASIGPGSSSQHLATDYLGPRWALGLSLERIRWFTDAYYTAPSSNPFLTVQGRTGAARDISVLAGVRAGYTLGGFRLESRILMENRYNFLFQNPETASDPDRVAEGAVDIRNVHLELRVSPSSIALGSR